MKNLNIGWTKEMHQLLGFLILKKVFGSYINLPNEERNKIDLYINEVKDKLSPNQISFVKSQQRKMEYSYKEDLLYSLEKMNWHEIHDGYGMPYLNVEYDEETYNV